jgi:pantetheine-phosphate adenylyltransferase
VVGTPRHKTTLFPLEERVALAREALAPIANVEVDVFKELVVDFARRWEARVIVKGLRVISDFEYEFQMNQLNRTLAPEIETVYVMASAQVSFVSSSGVKEIAAFGGTVEELVPAVVARRLRELFPNGRGGAPLGDQE